MNINNFLVLFCQRPHFLFETEEFKDIMKKINDIAISIDFTFEICTFNTSKKKGGKVNSYRLA
ncbi:MAG: hypothetical protein ACTHL3_02740 [Candidatus Nitrosocosmicus sp.]